MSERLWQDLMIENFDSDWLKPRGHLADMEKLADVIASLEPEEETLRLVISSLTDLHDQTEKLLNHKDSHVESLEKENAKLKERLAEAYGQEEGINND